jgi:MoxR-like ATPase
MNARDQITELQARMQQSIIGQEKVVERLVIGLLANGNLLVEGLPGLAKTRAIKALAKNLEADFSRIQFTPDLLPSDITGTEVFYQMDGRSEFRFEPGPIFANIVLGDEIKIIELVRSEEVQAGETAASSTDAAQSERTPATPLIAQEAVFAARREIGQIHVSDAMARYMADLVYATRTPEKYSSDLDRWIDVGGSPRASLALDKCGRTHAWLRDRDYVDPGDVRAIVHDVLRHRLMLSYEAQGEGVSADQVIDALVEQVALP